MTIRPDGSERRRSPRVKIGDRVRGTAVGLELDVIVHDLSDGGFLIESTEAFPVDAFHEFRIAAPDGAWNTVLTAKSVHCRQRADVKDPPSYLTGFAFVDPQGTDALRRLRALINQTTSVVRMQ